MKTLAFQAKIYSFTLLKVINDAKLWALGYFVVATWTVTDAVIIGYSENQNLGIPDDDFRISP